MWASHSLISLGLHLLICTMGCGHPPSRVLEKTKCEEVCESPGSVPGTPMMLVALPFGPPVGLLPCAGARPWVWTELPEGDRKPTGPREGLPSLPHFYIPSVGISCSPNICNLLALAYAVLSISTSFSPSLFTCPFNSIDFPTLILCEAPF